MSRDQIKEYGVKVNSSTISKCVKESLPFLYKELVNEELNISNLKNLGVWFKSSEGVNFLSKL